MTPMEILADEIRQADTLYKQNRDNLATQAYLNGLLMAQAILNGEID